MFIYKNYKHSAKATLVNGGIRLISFTSGYAAIMIASEGFMENLIVVSVLGIIAVFSFIISGKVSDEVAKSEIQKILSKRKNLVPMVIKDGKEVPDVENEVLRIPAQITFYRAPSVWAFFVPVKYIFNYTLKEVNGKKVPGGEIIKLKNGERKTITTMSAVNSFTLYSNRNLAMEDDISRAIFVVREGEHIEIAYKGVYVEYCNRSNNNVSLAN